MHTHTQICTEKDTHIYKDTSFEMLTIFRLWPYIFLPYISLILNTMQWVFPRWPLLLLLLSCFSRVQLCATPRMAAHQAPLSLGFSKQEHWSGLPFPSPMHESEK